MKLNYRIISLLLILFFVSLSAVCAEDTLQASDNETIMTDGQTSEPAGFYNLQQDIWKAQEGATIDLESDYVNDGVRANGVTIDRSITLDGHGHKMDGKSSDRIITIQKDGKGISKVTLKNINFVNGKKDTGGAIFANTGSNYLTIVNCTFTNNQATTNNIGGAVYIKASNYCTITDSTFTNNVAKGSGGAIRLEGNNAVIKNNEFSSNKATNSLGGAINALGNNIQITDNTFSKNTAGRDGGAIDIEGKEVNDKGKGHIISNNNFISNKAAGSKEGSYGGAVSINGQDCTISDNNFTGNHADTLGGAIRWNGASSNTGKITGNRFDSNDAQSGGAIYASASALAVSKNTFNGNKATKEAGGTIDIKGDSNTISNNEITKSSAKTSGGAIYIDGKSNKITDNTINGCSAGENGGALYQTGASATITGNKFLSNTAGKLAGAAQIKTSSASIKNNEFSQNTAGTSGGAAYIEGAKNTLNNNTFTKNKGGSEGVGGGVRWTGDDAVITGNTFSENTAKVGYAIYGSGANEKLSDNTYVPNEADTVRWEGSAPSKTATKLTAPNKNFKKSATKKVVITLKTSAGKAVASKKITLKVDGKKYKGTTNNKGQATIKVKISKKGKYKYTAKFAGDNSYAASKGKGTIKVK